MAPLSRLQRARMNPTDTVLPHQENYARYLAYYNNNGLYDDISYQLKSNGSWGESMRALKTPIQRLVEFYSSKIMAGPLQTALPLIAANPKLIKAIEQIWRWSNWGSKKQLYSRWLALFGDGFIKIAQKGDTPEDTRIFFQVLDPQWVQEFDVDERGFLVYTRIDIPTETVERGRTVIRWWTEEWTPTTKRIWESHEHKDEHVDKLGTPNQDEENTLGFVPIVHAPFRDVGELNGANAFIHALDKVDELNRQTSKLHSMMFRYNKPLHVAKTDMSASKDAMGKPKPIKMPDGGEIIIGEDVMLVLPPGTELEQLVPDIDWSAYLSAIEAMETEVMRDLPELKYYTLNSNDQSSGIALRYMLGDAIDRVVEARGNAYSSIIRANQIACTMAQRAGIAGFSIADIGTYEGGKLDHEIGDSPIIPLSPKDQADTVSVLITAGVKRSIAMKRNGFTDEEIAEQEEYDQSMKTPASVVPTGVQSDVMPMDATAVDDSPQGIL